MQHMLHHVLSKALILLLLFVLHVSGADQVQPQISEIVVKPASIKLTGPDSLQQIAVDARSNPKADWFDVTSDSKYVSANPKIAIVDPSGGVIAIADGKTEVTVSTGNIKKSVSVEITGLTKIPSINFTNQIMPIFTKQGCNGGGCHGKSGGQNGFRLSLLGFEPDLDYETLIFESRGRRLFPANPSESLLLLKAIGESPHGGGKRGCLMVSHQIL